MDSNSFRRLCALSWVLCIPAVASAKEAIPEHVRVNMLLSVRSADAAALVTVQGRTQSSMARLAVERTLMGTLEAHVNVSTDGIYAEDLQPGTRLLVFLKAGADGSWESNGRYERVMGNTIRDLPLERYLSATSVRVTRVLGERAKMMKSARRMKFASQPLSRSSRPSRAERRAL